MEYKLMLKSIRESKKITQEEMAKRLGITLPKYRTWEQGVTKIKLDDAYRCAKALGCTVNDLCGWTIETSRGHGSQNEDELVVCYRRSTPSRQASIMQTARDAALASKRAAERVSSSSYTSES